MEQLDIIWEKIKNYWRSEFHQPEIYCDENENIIIFNKENDLKILIGFQYTSSRYSDFIGHTKSFVAELNKWGCENYSSFKIYIISNYPLRKFGESSKIKTLPSDVDYFFADYNSFYGTIEIKHEDIIKSSDISDFNNRPWYHKEGIKIITDSRFDDWKQWERKGYRRRFYNFDQMEELYKELNKMSITHAGVIFVEELLLGYSVVWG